MINNIPKEWEIKELGNLVNFIIGKTPSRNKSEYFGGNNPWVSIADMKSKFLSHTKECITNEAIKDSGIKKVKKGTLLLSYKLSIGKLSFALNDLYTNEAIASLEILSDKLIKEFLYYVLKHTDLERTTDRAVMGKTLNKSKLQVIPIPIPPLQQQEKIVKVLDLSSNLIEKQKELLKNYDLFLKSKFIEMFGDPITNPMGWEVVNFEDIMILQRGYDLPINDRAIDGEIEVYGSNGVLDYHSEAKVRNGGVITGRSGTLGKVHYTLGDYWPLNTTLFSKDLKGNNIIYLAYFLEMFKVERFSQGAGVPTLNRNLVHKEKTYKVSLELQNKFASIVEKIETMKEKENQKLKQLEDLHNSLMQKAFKGEIQ